MSNYMSGCNYMAPWDEEDEEEMDAEDMNCPCVCPKCGSIHELSSAKKCRLCDGLFCPRCMESLIGDVCINCADDMEKNK